MQLPVTQQYRDTRAPSGGQKHYRSNGRNATIEPTTLDRHRNAQSHPAPTSNGTGERGQSQNPRWTADLCQKNTEPISIPEGTYSTYSSTPQDQECPNCKRREAINPERLHQLSSQGAQMKCVGDSPTEPLFRQTRTDGLKNIVIFGETGTGKSSLINMLSDKDVAIVSNKALGCTFESTGYPVTIDNKPYILWDTAGLNEGDAGSVPGDEALHHLRGLAERLEGRLSLLVYCIRGARYRDVIKDNYDLFTEIICQGEIPVAIVVTGLENEDRMDDWWDANKEEFTGRGMHFKDHACVTTSKGKKNMFEEEYEESKVAVRALINRCCSDDATWIVDSDHWFSRITDTIQRRYNGYHSDCPQATMTQDGEDHWHSSPFHQISRGFRAMLKYFITVLQLQVREG